MLFLSASVKNGPSSLGPHGTLATRYRPCQELRCSCVQALPSVCWGEASLCPLGMKRIFYTLILWTEEPLPEWVRAKSGSALGWNVNAMLV